MRSLGVVGISLSLLAASMDGPPVVRARHNGVQGSLVAPAVGEHMRVRANEAYGKLPLYFEANRGQTDDRVKFLARGRNYTMFLTGSEAVLSFRQSEPSEKHESHSLPRKPDAKDSATRTVLRTAFVAANRNARLVGLDELPGKANYFIGNDPAKWRTNVPTYTRVRYEDLYPGIDLVYYGRERALEYDFVVSPGADPASIALRFAGANKLEIDAEGDLLLHAGSETIRQRKPLIYQVVDGVRREISGNYVLKGECQAVIQVSRYDTSRPLVIDPEILFYSTYLGGGSGNEFARGIVVDADGNAYVTGSTGSFDFPTTAGAFQPAYAGGADAFVTKLNPTGSGLVYSTYLGGGQLDTGFAIAVDDAGNAYIGGNTSNGLFPTTPGAFQPKATNTLFNNNAFVTKLDPTGSALVYSTYLGEGDTVYGIAVDALGNACVAGATFSPDFPTTLGAFDTTFNGPVGASDAFAAKLNPLGSGLVYSTFLGGMKDDAGRGLAVDASGDVYVVGYTASPDFPTTAGAFRTTLGGAFNAFVTKLNATGSLLAYSTYLGGSNLDVGLGIAVDTTGNAYVTGQATSVDFPTTVGTFQPIYGGGGSDVFVTKLDLAGAALVYSSYLGGTGTDGGHHIAIDSAGEAYTVGFTDSTDFPITGGTVQHTFNGSQDAFVTKINATASGLVYSTYLGGDHQSDAVGVALDALPVPNAYIVGITNSTNFPTTPGAFQTALAGSFGYNDAFVAKITEANSAAGPFTARVTGGGTINVAGGIGTFSFIIRQSTTGALSGRLQYINHASGARVVSDAYGSLMIVGNTASFNGTCGATCSFTVNVIDNGEPGSTDSFSISVSGGLPEGGLLRSGNIQIQ